MAVYTWSCIYQTSCMLYDSVIRYNLLLLGELFEGGVCLITGATVISARLPHAARLEGQSTSKTPTQCALYNVETNISSMRKRLF